MNTTITFKSKTETPSLSETPGPWKDVLRDAKVIATTPSGKTVVLKDRYGELK